MPKGKRYQMKKNIIWGVILLITVGLNNLFYLSYNEMMLLQIEGPKYLLIILSVLLNVFIGFSLGTDHLLEQFNKKNSCWKINKYKLYIIGIPTLIIALLPIISLVLHTFIFVNNYPTKSSIIVLTQIICGYTLVTSFYKEQ